MEENIRKVVESARESLDTPELQGARPCARLGTRLLYGTQVAHAALTSAPKRRKSATKAHK